MAERGQLSAERDAWQRILLDQARSRPCWQLQDVYKLAFQAALGSEHAAPNEAAARQWLEQEAATLGAGPADPQIEPISPDGRLVRVNLRPYLAAGGNLDALLQAFLRTAVEWRGERETLLRYTSWVVEFAQAGRLPFPAAEMRAYFQRIAEADFPAAHHSASYREVYRPAYRVVLKMLL